MVKVHTPTEGVHPQQVKLEAEDLPGDGSSHVVRSASKQSENGAKVKARSVARRPGSCSRGRKPKVGLVQGPIFQRRFKRRIKGDPCEPLKVPGAFRPHLRGAFLQKVVVANVCGTAWTVQLMEYQESVFFDFGWSVFVEPNGIDDRDTLIFKAMFGEEVKAFEVSIFGQDGCWSQLNYYSRGGSVLSH